MEEMEKTPAERNKELYALLGLDEAGKPIKGDFSKKTKQGYSIQEIIKVQKTDYVIAYREEIKDYIVGAGYDKTTGYWEQGYYSFPSVDSATNFVKHILN